MWHNFNIILTTALNSNTRVLSYFAVTILLIAASIIDYKQHRIPDNLVIAGAVTGLGFSLLDSYAGFLNSLIGGIAAGLVLLLIFYITKGGLGLGDVKLFGCVGIYLGLSGVVSAMLTAAFLSGLFSFVLICINRDNKKREIPFAPFILAGTLAAIIF